MKKWSKSLAAVLLFLSVFVGLLTTPMTTEAASSYTAYVTASSLRLQNQAGSRYKTVRTLYRSTAVTVTGKKGSYAKVRYGRESGYVQSRYLSKFRPYSAYVSAPSLNVRNRASTHFKSVVLLRRLTRVTVFGRSGSYLEVSVGSRSGYVQSKYISTFRPFSAYVNSPTLSVRDRASNRFRTVTLLHMGAKVTVFGRSGSYSVVLVGSRVGYVPSGYLGNFIPYGAYVTVSSLSVRTGPSTHYSVIRYLYKNTKVTVYTAGGGWSKVVAGGTNGYVSSTYIKRGSPPKPVVKVQPQPVVYKPQAAAPQVQAFKVYSAYIGYDNLNVHKSPDTQSTVVMQLRERTKISVIGQSGSWVKISYGGKTGYVLKDNVTTNLSDFNLPRPSGSQLGIDISHYQGTVNFTGVKKSGISFVVIKASQGSGSSSITDSYFLNNAVAAQKTGLSINAYHFFTAATISDANKEADNFARILNAAAKKGVKFQNLYLDVETSNNIPTKSLKSTLTNNVLAFLSRMRINYHYSNLGIYSNSFYFNNNLDLNKIEAQPGQQRILIWLSRYRGESTYLGPGFSADLWQYTSNGTVSGVNGAVDQDIAYFTTYTN
ncbi:hypothetical protein E4665_02560 [Sporolactobacillus shoreae]|uniref:SH3b domain-containing protein n=1 Tax=Sporolactobacillus shoreae TaxID=1465501 RepID=A0A4Z0GUA6_9BACL|nr:SH3 domain-containing protein [Sporolactobacillus shoreae]TGA99848.1 hypothetical protein E4665_02560 [Sporolactobacillus shoreae]